MCWIRGSGVPSVGDMSRLSKPSRHSRRLATLAVAEFGYRLAATDQRRVESALYAERTSKPAL